MTYNGVQEEFFAASELRPSIVKPVLYVIVPVFMEQSDRVKVSRMMTPLYNCDLMNSAESWAAVRYF